MATRKKTNETRTKAAVGRERRITLALKAVLDAAGPATFEKDNDRYAMEEAETAANELLNELGYADLESIPVRVAKLNEQLKAAVESGNGKEIARLGEELDRAQRGLPPSKVKGEKVKAADA